MKSHFRARVLLTSVPVVLTALAALWMPERAAAGQTSADREVRESEVRIPSGTIQIAATLMRPADSRRHPAIVLLPGSGPHSREPALDIARHLAARGLVVLAYDKRGTGQSEGDWTTASLADLTDDARACMDFLRRDSGVASRKVGLWAPSQGAWVASRLAAQGGAPAFLIAVSGGGVAPLETERFAYRNALRAAGASAEDIQSADSLLDRYFTYLRSGAGRDELLKEIERARAFAWYGQLNLHRVLPSEKTRDRWEWVSTYDPLPDVRMMKSFPVLLLFGENDVLQPTKVAVERWKTGLASAGNRDVEVRVFAGAGHFLRQEGPNPHQPGPYVDGLLETVDRWLDRRLLLRPPPQSPVRFPGAGTLK